MKTKLILLFALIGISVQAQVSTRVAGSGSLTNFLAVSGGDTKLFTVQGFNAAANTLYVQVHQTNNVPAVGLVPQFSFPVASSNYFSMDFGQYGADLYRCSVVISTNPAVCQVAQTNAVAIQAITRR